MQAFSFIKTDGRDVIMYIRKMEERKYGDEYMVRKERYYPFLQVANG